MKRRVILVGLLFLAATLARNVRAASPAQAATTPQAALADAGPAARLTLKAAVEYARAHYPAIRAALADTAAAESGIRLARTAYLPRTDLLLQFNRATRNNVFGMILPNGVIPAISGPVLGESTIDSTFGSAAGVRFSWEPFDFGLRGANVAVAESVRRRGQAESELTELNVSLGAADAFLEVIAAQQAVLAARANVDRLEVFHNSIAVLVRNQLRPGADQSRAKAELAQAQIEWIRAEQARDVARATLAESLGRAGESIEVETGALLSPPPADLLPAADLAAHPLAEVQDAEVAVVSSRRRALEKSYRPKFFLESAAFGRGTGARVDGTFQGGAHGLGPSEANWAVGMNVLFPVLDFKENRVRQEIERDHENAESARYDAVVQRLRSEVEKARVQVENARRVAERTPVALEAAQVLDTQARERYRAGLGTVTEVADALRLLRQSEIENSLAQLAVWRALLDLSGAQGDIDNLLNQTVR
jgi:outer membrane protein